jgi:hypothetical protein
MKCDATLELPVALADDGQAAGVASRAGFFWCGHCNHVVTLSQREVDAAESAPTGSLVKMKCPRCHHHEARWRFPSPPRPVKRVARGGQLVKPLPPVTLERGRELFAAIFQQIGLAH